MPQSFVLGHSRITILWTNSLTIELLEVHLHRLGSYPIRQVKNSVGFVFISPTQALPTTLVAQQLTPPVLPSPIPMPQHPVPAVIPQLSTPVLSSTSSSSVHRLPVQSTSTSTSRPAGQRQGKRKSVDDRNYIDGAIIAVQDMMCFRSAQMALPQSPTTWLCRQNIAILSNCFNNYYKL